MYIKSVWDYLDQSWLDKFLKCICFEKVLILIFFPTAESNLIYSYTWGMFKESMLQFSNKNISLFSRYEDRHKE